MQVYSKILLIIILLFSFADFTFSQSTVISSFDSLITWKTIAADAVDIETKIVPGITGNAIQIDFNFTTGTGYCGIQKKIPLVLPANFIFTFYLKAAAPVNNLEFKLVDKTGDNVWWFNQRNFEFQNDWQKITIKRRDIEFAWGPTDDRALKSIDKIEIFIASSSGGKGSIVIDDLAFEELEIPDLTTPNPLAIVSSFMNGYPGQNIVDGNYQSVWENSPDDVSPEIIIDLQKHYEYGGLIIDWDTEYYAQTYDLFISHNRSDWEKVYTVIHSKGGRSYISLKDVESRYLKLSLTKSSKNNLYRISEIQIKDFSFGQTPENIFKEMAKDNPAGYFPRYLSDKQTYWTLTGVNNDYKEALINEDGMVEIDKSMFSIEPFLFIENKLFTREDVNLTQKLEQNYLPVPSVNWMHADFNLETKIFADGPAAESVLYLLYTLKNKSNQNLKGNLYLAIRPFQVNPPWQFLNWPGGIAKINDIKFDSSIVQINSDKKIYTLTPMDNFGAAEFDEGEIVYHLSENKLPHRKSINDHTGYASAAYQYAFNLKPNESKQVILAVPFHESNEYITDEKSVDSRLKTVLDFWQNKINNVEFNLPESANRIINTIRSNLAYILINRDGFGIQPGSRSYERSWMRDGSLTSSALLKMGIHNEVKDFVSWYSGYQFANGKVPCVVDRRGPDPTPEHDSHGQLIFAIMQYYLFTKDTIFLKDHFENILKSIAYMDQLRAESSAEKFISGTQTEKACYGLLPESISHEGYSAKPMHSYWDDFFALKGYKDAVRIARILGEDKIAEKISISRNEFKTNLYRSIDRAVKNKNISFIPGCVELGDFDATSTAISIYPANELFNLPQPLAENTFDRYFQFFINRKNNSIEWRDYTPYEVRLIGTFIYLGQVERAHALIDFFFKYQYPAGWNHWAEVVRKEKRTPGFIGDMPHTWVGSDFINAARSLFVYEDESDQSLIIGAGLYDDWINNEEGMSVKNMPTYYGNLNYSINPIQNGYTIKISGELELPAGNIKIRNFKPKKPKKVLINGTLNNKYYNDFIFVQETPAVVNIEY